MRRPTGKVIGPHSLLHATYAFADYILLICVALITKLEAANKAFAKERTAWQVAD
jgi:hypothetical protein